MNILMIEPFYSGSHESWIKGIIKHSRHNITVLSLPGKHWKWRMQGGAIPLAKEFNVMESSPDLIIASDMLDLPAFLALTRKKSSSIPVAVYFHENQLTYPWSPNDRDRMKNRDRYFALINYKSALAADYVLFNSKFHHDSFINALPGLLSQNPDYHELDSVELIKRKSRVLYLGLTLKKFDKMKPVKKIQNDIPIILWNHRWEYDKNPGQFFKVLHELDEKGLNFRAIIIGESPASIAAEFRSGKEKLEKKIIRYGYVDTFREYSELLWMSDILPVTSNQDFFGISIMEALYCGCIPLLPRRLTYPELIPIDIFENFFYRDGFDLSQKLEKMLSEFNTQDRSSFMEVAQKYDWNRMIDLYDSTFATMAGIIT